MTTEFAVIFATSQHFGDNSGLYDKEDPAIEFKGSGARYRFATAAAHADAEAVLMFESFGVSFRSNVIRINETELAGGISPSIEREWQGHVLVVPAGSLRAGGENELHVEARTRSGEVEGNLDDFLLANMVIFYRAR